MNTEIISEKEFEDSKAWGLLTSIDLFNCNPETLRDKEKIKEYVIELCKLLNLQRYSEPIIVRFGKDEKVKGYSLIQLIETSSITAHFVEKSNSIYLDIFSCKFYEQEKAVQFTKKFFQAEKLKFNIILRGV